LQSTTRRLLREGTAAQSENRILCASMSLGFEGGYHPAGWTVRRRSRCRLVATGVVIDLQTLDEGRRRRLEGVTRLDGELPQAAGLRKAVRMQQEQRPIVRRLIGELQKDLRRRAPGEMEAPLSLEAEIAGTGDRAQAVGHIVRQDVRP